MWSIGLYPNLFLTHNDCVFFVAVCLFVLLLLFFVGVLFVFVCVMVLLLLLFVCLICFLGKISRQMEKNNATDKIKHD